MARVQPQQSSKVMAAAAAATNSTISRLESKYSDILDRVQKRKEKQQDRDKTLEPTDYSYNPLSRSATTNSVGLQKERTPYRLTGASNRHRNKYLTSNLDTDYNTGGGGSGGGGVSNKKRLDLNDTNNNSRDYYKTIKTDYDLNRNKDTLMNTSSSSAIGAMTSKAINNSSNDIYHDGIRYNRGAAGGGTSTNGNATDNNIYKSKYDPDVLYSEITNSNKAAKRQIKSYNRNNSNNENKHNTAINLYELDIDDRPSSSTALNHRNYAQRKQQQQLNTTTNGNGSTTASSALQQKRSQTQRFFDADDVCAVSDDDANNNNNKIVDKEYTERENKRKEIQSLIMKYAQLDDIYGKSTILDEPSIITSDMQIRSPMKIQKSQTTANIFQNNTSSHNLNNNNNDMAPVPMTRTRIPKVNYSTTVRIIFYVMY